MRTHRLYPDPSAPLAAGGLALPVAGCARLDVDPSCSRCALSKVARNPCVPPEGVGEGPGPLLLVGEHPGRSEDAARRPFVGSSGKYLRELVARWWKGPVVLDNAVRCFAAEVESESVDACRPFLAATLDEARPTRVVALGRIAWVSLTGRATTPVTQRRAFCWHGDAPVFLTVNPAAAQRNRFVSRDFEEDLEWALTAPPPFPSPRDLEWREVESDADALLAEMEMRSFSWVSIDAETSGLQYTPGFRVLSVAVSSPDGRACWVWGKEQLDDPSVRAPLADLLADPRIGKTGANIKSDLAFLAERIGPVRNVHGDVRLWRKLESPEASGYLEDIAELVGFGGHKDEMMAGVVRAEEALRRRLRKNAAAQRVLIPDAGPLPVHEPDDIGAQLKAGVEMKKLSYGLVPRDLLLRYNARDAISTAWAASLLEPRVSARDGLGKVWSRIVRPMSEALAGMEAVGVPVSVDAIDAFDAHLATKLTDVRKRLDHYGKDFNPDSTPQVRALLFNDLKLRPPPETETATGLQSTSEEVLEAMSGQHPIVQDILDHRGLAKLKGTYADGMRAHLRRDASGLWRIHPNILPDGARTGRCSCVDPNLQNIPRATTDEGRMARNVFAARPGWVIVHCDFAQLEYRIAAMLSGDPEMLAILQKGIDFHTGTAMVIAPYLWRVTYTDASQVQKAHRDGAKTINFALLYGQGDGSTARKLKTTLAEAERVRLAVLGKFRMLAEWIKKVTRETKLSGYSRTWWDGAPARWRPIYSIGDPDEGRRADGERRAVNSPIQGTAADFLNASLSLVSDWIRDNMVPAELCLAIHDALLLHVREDAVDEVAWNVRRLMLSHKSGGVPLDVDVEVGPAWGSLKKYKLAA